ncbi:sugar transferase [Vibrio aerogenes]|nr:sugar transferase [Vibrio aerogenes]
MFSLTQPLIHSVKRSIDILGALAGLIVLSPVLPIVALAIKATSPGPVIYRQWRVGKSTPEQVNLFEMFKFRTMVQNAEVQSGAVWATENDPRITRIGRFLRKTRLDEIPQLVNVLKGEMSLIGPRPERPAFYSNLEEKIPFFTERTYGILPGITGLAQISQGYDTCIDDVRRKVAFDHSYSLSMYSFKSWLLMDMKIIGKTLLVMVCGKGQ